MPWRRLRAPALFRSHNNNRQRSFTPSPPEHKPRCDFLALFTFSFFLIPPLTNFHESLKRWLERAKSRRLPVVSVFGETAHLSDLSNTANSQRSTTRQQPPVCVSVCVRLRTGSSADTQVSFFPPTHMKWRGGMCTRHRNNMKTNKSKINQ